MDGSIRLKAEERKTALRIYRGSGDARNARRAHLLLLLDAGMSVREIKRITFCSSDLILSVKRRYLADGLDAAISGNQPEDSIPFWQFVVAGWLLQKSPRDFGFFRSRWTCEMVAELLEQEHGIQLSGETVRRALQDMGFVWRRPRPIVGPTDPDYAWKLRRIKRLLASLPSNEVAVFQDEVDVHLNPKIGSCWMPKGDQAEIPTPGNNVKRHIAGSLVWQTGTLLISEPGARRNAELFVAHLEDLRRRLRRYTKIHVICDNAPFHDCRRVQDYLQRWGPRIELHFLPKYAPETNPIERVWWHLHETITRNHRCQTITELIDLTYDWFEANNNHYLDMRHTFAAAA